MNKIAWLDNLGRKTRSRQDTNIGMLISSQTLPNTTNQSPTENIIGHLSKVAINHEKDDTTDRWHLAPRTTEAEVDE